MKSRPYRIVAVLAVTVAALACGNDTSSSFLRPSQPIEASLYDLAQGPIDRASAVNIVAGRGNGIPRTIRVDVTDEWDVAFGVVDGERVWLPSGFFEGFEPDAGILEVSSGFDQLTEAPANKDLYEKQEPIPLREGAVYIVRSRTDPGLSVPCHIFAKISVETVQEDPPRVDLLILWNPNCDDRNLTPGESL